MQAGAGSDKEMEMSEIIRLDKYLADMGCGTRSQVKQMIRKGQVEINGEKIKKPEQKITTAQDRVCVAGKEIRYEKYRYYLLHKPAGYVSATTDNRDKTVLELLPENIRRELFPVGRLDKDTEGLLLLTNDGELAHRLLSPKKHVDKTYYARIGGKVDDEDIVGPVRVGLAERAQGHGFACEHEEGCLGLERRGHEASDRDALSGKVFYLVGKLEPEDAAPAV